MSNDYLDILNFGNSGLRFFPCILYLQFVECTHQLPNCLFADLFQSVSKAVIHRIGNLITKNVDNLDTQQECLTMNERCELILIMNLRSLRATQLFHLQATRRNLKFQGCQGEGNGVPSLG